MASKKPSKKPSKKKPSARIRKKRIWTQKAKWQYCFKTRKYLMNEIKKGVTYQTILDQLSFNRMMGECINTKERADWLVKNNKNALKVSSKKHS